MYLDWTKNLKTEEEKQQFTKDIKGSKPVLDRLREILAEYERSLSRSETEITTFDMPGWDYRQAYKNGFRACLNKVSDLVDVDKKITRMEGPKP
jgi:hypothetical protein